MKKDTENINYKRRDKKAARTVVYLVCILIMAACLLLDVYFILGLFE